MIPPFTFLHTVWATVAGTIETYFLDALCYPISIIGNLGQCARAQALSLGRKTTNKLFL